ncbi:hypothetical protein [Sphingomonas nostoxanthinifaciens]|uniref:hypothetical protein n=1 Tax=Sphingomonas nostoxanthinifaciens TaxID=2872652 RepID=UPI001CC2138B|nr:hypothetical protein [Sphingomonas nostoxanthinifaciens]UAK26334.1 hypothetical protein K8P63_09725 [Sphingomonas nostoxanthinifaciens]
MRFPAFACLALLATAASASTEASWRASNAAGRAACIRAAGLRAATASAPVGFSDAIGRDAILVTGVYRQAFMKGARGTMLCLYDRRTHNAEVAEAKGWSAR